MTENRLRGKIAVTGTGRCGTSFLMRLLTAYDPDFTGFQAHDHMIVPGVQAGMEHVVDARSDRWDFLRLGRVWKDPGLMTRLPGLVERGDVPALLVVPVRRVEHAAKSRLANNRPWFPDHPVDLSKQDEWPEWATQEAQAKVLREGLGRLVETAALYQIPIQFVRWETLGDAGALYSELSAKPYFGHSTDSLVAKLFMREFGRFKRAHAATWGKFVR